MTAAAFAALLLALLAAHHVADHWVQSSAQAAAKGARDRSGALACLAHVASYTACTVAFGALAWWLLALPISPWGFAAGQVLSAVTHYWADRRFTLAWLARVLGKDEYYKSGGAYALDQSFHWLWLTVAAGVTVVA